MKLLLSVLKDIRYSYKYSILIMLQLIISLFVLSFTISFINISNEYKQLYNKDLENATLLMLRDSNQAIPKTELEEHGISYGYLTRTGMTDTRARLADELSVTVMSEEMRRMEVPLYKGKHFSSDSYEYYEAIVSYYLSDIYSINNTYKLYYDKMDKEIDIKIIGYLDKNNYSPYFWGNGFNLLYDNEADIVLCDDRLYNELDIDISRIRYALVFDEEPDKIKEAYLNSVNVDSVADMYNNYIEMVNKDKLSYSLFAIIVLSMVFLGLGTTMLLRLDKDLKLQATYIVLGESRSKVVLYQLITYLMYLSIPTILNFSAIGIINLVSETGFASYKSLIQAFVIVGAIYLVSAVYFFIRIIITKPIRIIKGEI